MWYKKYLEKKTILPKIYIYSMATAGLKPFVVNPGASIFCDVKLLQEEGQVCKD
jgi:hypothetical protein